MTFVNPDPAACVLHALQCHDWFADLPATTLAGLADAGRWVRLDAGEILFHEAQQATSCLLVCSGHVQGLRYTSDGDEKVFGQIGPGGMVSALALFLEKPLHQHCIRALDEVEGCLFDGAAFRRLCHGDARLACRILEHGAWLVRHHTDQIDWLTSSSAEERLAEYILRAGKPQPGQPVMLPLTHSQIAVKLGMRSETLSRVLGKWRQQGYIAKRRTELRVLDLDSLRRLATCGLPDADLGAGRG